MACIECCLMLAFFYFFRLLMCYIGVFLVRLDFQQSVLCLFLPVYLIFCFVRLTTVCPWVEVPPESKILVQKLFLSNELFDFNGVVNLLNYRGSRIARSERVEGLLLGRSLQVMFYSLKVFVSGQSFNFYFLCHRSPFCFCWTNCLRCGS